MSSQVEPSEGSNVVLMQKGCVLRVTMKETGGVRVSIDHNILHDVEMKDVLFLIGCVRQLEHTLLTHYNERANAGDDDED